MKTKEQVLAWIREHNFEAEMVKNADHSTYIIGQNLLLNWCIWPIENHDLWENLNDEFMEWYGDDEMIQISNNKLV